MAIIKSAAPNTSVSILDVGGGTSHLVDELLFGYFDLTVLDVSQAALNRSKERLGRLAKKVSWIAADITKWKPSRTWDVWHDRAVFHFLTATEDQDAYIAALEAGTKQGSVIVMSTFALDGPERCSGLPVQRYSPAALAARIGDRFQLISEASESHATPWGTIQDFTYVVLRRR
ncbi:MAG: class I SAM-dependent methyltransferase [Rhizomicrobium sp.]